MARGPELSDTGYEMIASRWFILLVAASSLVFGQAPAISKGGVVDAASFSAGRPVSAGNIVSIFGSNLATKVALADTVPLSSNLANTTVSFNGINAALQFVAPGQINAQIPWNVPVGTANVVVTSQGVPSPAEPVVINSFGPGVYSNNGHAYALNVQDPTSIRYASFAAPVDTFGTGCSIVPQPSTCAFKAFPARVGDLVIIYAGGLGPIDTVLATGAAPTTVVRTTTTPTLLVNNVPAAPVGFSGMAPGYPGIYQINATIPQVPAGNAVPFQLQIGGITTPNTTNIAVQ